jgi:putative ABC transport system permease protein
VTGPRVSKILRDTFGRPGRSLLVAFAIAAAVFEVGTIGFSYAILAPVLGSMYERTTPASATLVVSGATDALVDSVRRVPGVAAAEWRPTLLARVRVSANEWVPLALYVIRDFDALQLDTFEPDRGRWPPQSDEILLERTGLQVAEIDLGDSLRVRTPGGDDTSLRVAGTVHAEGLAPAWMDHIVSGFVPWGSIIRGEGRGESARIRIRVSEHVLDEGYIREVADAVAATITRQGFDVLRIDVPPPGRHPHADQMEAFTFLILAFGIVTFIVSAILAATMMNAVMSEQVKQIGIMKAIGASNGQIASIYLGQVGLLSAVAVLIGLPPAILAGRAYAAFSAKILNANVTGSPFPLGTIAAVVVIGFAVPLLASLVPVLRAARLDVHRALGDDMPSVPRLGRDRRGVSRVPRPLLLGLRAALARPGRLGLTILMMSCGGAAFMSALNVASAWNRAVDDDIGRRHYDLTVAFAENHPVEDLESVIRTVPGVERAEYWPGTRPFLIEENGVAGGRVNVVGIDPESRLLNLPQTGGRWLLGTDANAAVINQTVVALNPELAVGRPVEVRADGKTTAFTVVGIVRELMPSPVIYTLPANAVALSGVPAGTARVARIVTRSHDDASERAAAEALEQAFERAGIEVSVLQRMQDLKKAILDHLVIIMTILTVASSVVLVVGGLGLFSALALSVVQRTREIGVLSAIGATPALIALHVWCEGMVLAGISWVAAHLLAIPFSYGLEAVCGRIFFKAPLEFHLSPMASVAWLGVVVVLGTLGSVQPALHAARMSVRESLSHA